MRAILTTATAVALWGAAAAPALPRSADAERSPRAASGAVEGVVRLGATDQAPPAMLSPYARRRYSPPSASAQPAASASDVVVYLLDVPSAPAAREATIAQRNLTISPHVTAVQVGTRIDFPNEDNVFHNLFSLSTTQPFNLGRYPRGESRSQLFRKAGVVRMFCDIHSDMSGVILVLDTPHFTRPDAGGRFRLAGVPEGRHRVVAWHESAGADTVEVVVGAGGVATADFRIPR